MVERLTCVPKYPRRRHEPVPTWGYCLRSHESGSAGSKDVGVQSKEDLRRRSRRRGPLRKRDRNTRRHPTQRRGFIYTTSRLGTRDSYTGMNFVSVTSTVINSTPVRLHPTRGLEYTVDRPILLPLNLCLSVYVSPLRVRVCLLSSFPPSVLSSLWTSWSPTVSVPSRRGSCKSPSCRDSREGHS